jgi:hypothetical protein
MTAIGAHARGESKFGGMPALIIPINVARGLDRGGDTLSAAGPGLPTLALQRVGSNLGYTGCAADAVGRAAIDP